MENITLTGKLTVIPAGHKIGPEKTPTWYRDEAGNFHAEFYKATVGQQGEDGKFHSYTWNISADEAEAFANMPIGTTFRVTLREKLTEKTVVDAKGVPQTQMLPRVTPSQNGQTMFHDVVCEDIEVAKQGTIKRPRTTQYFADVKWTEEPADAAADTDEG